MKKYQKIPLYSTFLFILLVGISCEKVIHLKTENVPPKYVIEANMSDQKADCIVYITKTVQLNDPTNFPGVSGALVSIIDNGGTPVFLNELRPGVYFSDLLQAQTGHSYELTVELGSQKFTSTATAPGKVNFDSLYLEDFQAFGEIRKFAHVIFKDPVGKGNAYRFLQFKNGEQNSNIFVMNDEYSDGRSINTFLAYFDQSDDQRIIPGDTIRVQMQCVDQSVYKFFYSLSQSSTGGTEVVSPGNPVTNIRGGALGYFNVFIKQEKTIIAGK